MKFLLTPLGSHGDVHPFVGLALELRRRGHDVVVMTSGHFRSLIEKLDFPFVEIGSAEEFREAVSHPDAWHPQRGMKLLFGYMLRAVRPLYDAIEERYEPGNTILVHPPIAFGARIAREKLRVPSATIHLAPMSLRTVEQPTVLAGVFMPAWSPRWFRRLMFWSGDRFFIDPLCAGHLNHFRSELGLAPVKNVGAGWWNSPDRIIGLFPEWFAPIPSDWPPQVRVTGFPLFDEGEHTELDPELEQFLQAGSPPLIFTPGSAMMHGGEFFQAALQACEQLKQRGIFITGYEDHLPDNLPETIRVFRFIPFSQIFPRSAVVVHHGGIGTTAQGFAAGMPQLIMPMAYDQPDNAARIKRLGAGDILPPHQFNGANLIDRLKVLLAPEKKKRCAEIAGWIDKKDGISQSCDLLEEVKIAQEQPGAGGEIAAK